MGTIIGIKDGSFSGNEERSSIFAKMKRKYSVIFSIVADSVDETWTSILNTPKLPKLLEDWKGDGCRCKSRTPKEAHTIHFNRKLTILWEVECTFDSEVVFKPFETDDPLQWPIELSLSTEDVTELLTQDVVTGKPIQNPNGEKIQIEVPRSYPVIEFSRYESYPDNPLGVAQLAAKIAYYSNKLNADTFLGCSPGNCFMHAPRAMREAINGGYFFKVTYRITIRGGLEPYKARPLCEGYTYRVAKGFNIRSTAEIYGQNIKINLDLDGVESDEPVYLAFNQYESVVFADLGLA
ncbi:MAG: hypothetical protein IJU53_04095 [Thermoguttaceae bacterium]|nr:hypothetical protein [Thermoguttaceae bacterium]